MASTRLRSTTTLLNSIPKRYASTATQAKSSGSAGVFLPKEPIRISNASNGIKVASLENNSPITRIAAVFDSGSRDETYKQQGMTHALRVFSSLATRNFSVFGLSRNLDQAGAQLSVTSSREQTMYLLEGTRNKYQRGIEILNEILNRPEFRHWEIDDARPRLQFDLDVYDEEPELRIVDLIHKVAFKNGLAQPIYAPRFNLGSINEDSLRQFKEANYTNNRMTLVGVGISHDDLLRVADQYALPKGKALEREKSKYIGGEIREEHKSDLVHVALASEGVSLSSSEVLASEIVAQAFGSGPHIKYSSGSSKLARAVSGASHPALARSFNANYSDNGLFGFHIIANKNDLSKTVKGVFQEVAKTSKSGLSSEEITSAKNSLKIQLASSLENPSNLVNKIALNPEASNTSTNINELFKSVDSVTANDINAFVKRLATSKPSLAAIGDLSDLPRIDEITA